MLFFKGNGRNVHVQTKGVYVCYVIYFTSLLYHEIIVTANIHNECNLIDIFLIHIPDTFIKQKEAAPESNLPLTFRTASLYVVID